MLQLSGSAVQAVVYRLHQEPNGEAKIGRYIGSGHLPNLVPGQSKVSNWTLVGSFVGKPFRSGHVQCVVVQMSSPRGFCPADGAMVQERLGNSGQLAIFVFGVQNVGKQRTKINSFKGGAQESGSCFRGFGGLCAKGFSAW